MFNILNLNKRKKYFFICSFIILLISNFLLIKNQFLVFAFNRNQTFRSLYDTSITNRNQINIFNVSDKERIPYLLNKIDLCKKIILNDNESEKDIYYNSPNASTFKYRIKDPRTGLLGIYIKTKNNNNIPDFRPQDNTFTLEELCQKIYDSQIFIFWNLQYPIKFDLSKNVIEYQADILPFLNSEEIYKAITNKIKDERINYSIAVFNEFIDDKALSLEYEKNNKYYNIFFHIPEEDLSDEESIKIDNLLGKNENIKKLKQKESELKDKNNNKNINNEKNEFEKDKIITEPKINKNSSIKSYDNESESFSSKESEESSSFDTQKEEIKWRNESFFIRNKNYSAIKAKKMIKKHNKVYVINNQTKIIYDYFDVSIGKNVRVVLEPLTDQKFYYFEFKSGQKSMINYLLNIEIKGKIENEIHTLLVPREATFSFTDNSDLVPPYFIFN
ncbi:MAG: putative secreted protein [Candidatus Phytoplasma cynodontis]|nr:MAG: putative secreted protein [Candidatus Phytoplasma cynodontis]